MLPQARAYKKFKVVEIFDVANTHCVLGSWVKDGSGNTPYVTAGVGNNSIAAYVSYRNDMLDRGNAIVIGGKTLVVTYQKDDFFSNDSHNLVLRLKEEYERAQSESTYLYLVAAVKAGLGSQYSWGNSISYKKIQDDEIILPVTTHDSSLPDFDFMEEYIRALERERTRALEAYLKVAGFDNPELTIDEETALVVWKTARMREFKIGGTGGLFDISSPPKRFNANAVTFGGNRPYVVRTSQNNGQRGCIVADEKYLSEGNTISFGQDTATIFYQEKQYFTGDKIKVMKFNERELDERTAMFLITVMRRAFSGFMWGTSSFDEKILKNVVVRLPVNSSDDIDFVLIENFIRAVMKTSIAGVIVWKDKEIATTARAVGTGEDRLPMRILRDVADALKFREYLPVYSLRAACGLFGDGESVVQEGWVKVEGKGRLDDTQFVVKTKGVSMEGLIEEGSYAVFRKLGGGGLEGKVLLVQRLEAGDPESGGAYTIKKFTRKGGKVVLKARNPESGDIELESDAEYSTKYRAIAEFKDVIP